MKGLGVLMRYASKRGPTNAGSWTFGLDSVAARPPAWPPELAGQGLDFLGFENWSG